MFEENSQQLKIPCKVYKRIVRESFAQNERYVTMLAQAIQDTDFEKMQFAAHTLKGAYSNLRIQSVAQPAEEIDTIARSQSQGDGLNDLFMQMQQALNELKEALDATGVDE